MSDQMSQAELDSGDKPQGIRQFYVAIEKEASCSIWMKCSWRGWNHISLAMSMSSESGMESRHSLRSLRDTDHHASHHLLHACCSCSSFNVPNTSKHCLQWLKWSTKATLAARLTSCRTSWQSEISLFPVAWKHLIQLWEAKTNSRLQNETRWNEVIIYSK